MATLGDLVVNVVGNTQRLGKDLNKGRGMLSSFAGGAMKILGPVAAAAGAVFGGKAAINAARTQVQAEKKLAGVLKATGGAAGLSAKQIADYASELQGVTNFGDEATIAAAGVLATFKEVKGDNFKRVLALSQDLAETLDGDLKGSTIQLGKALNDPAKGYSALAEAGVSFTQQQIEQIKALQQSGDLLGAQEVILKELESEVGGVAQSMADPLTQVMGVVGDLAENFGFLLLPAVNAISGAVKGLIGPASGARETFEALGARIGNVVQSVIDFLQAHQATIVTIGKFIGVAAGAAAAIAGIGAVATTIGPIIGAAITVAMGPVGMITAAVTGIGAAIVHATGEGETFGEKINSTFGQIPDLIDGLAFTFRNFGAIAQIALIDIVQAGLSAFPMLEEPIERVAAFFVGTFSGIKAFFGAFVQNVIGGFKEIGNVAKAIGAGASAAFEAISSGDFTGAASAFSDAFVKELSSQKDVVGGGNPFEAYAKAFTEARDQTLATFQENGGLGATLEKQKQELLDGIAQAEADRKAALDKVNQPKGLVPGTDTAQAEAAGGESGIKTTKDIRAAEALDARSREAFEAITRATSGAGPQDPQKAMKKTLDKSLVEQQTQTDSMKRVERNTEPLRKLKVIPRLT